MYMDVWANLEHTLRTGESAFITAHGISMWEYLERNPEAGNHFSHTMGAGSNLVAQSVLDAFDFPGTGKVIDIGAGDGSFLASVLEQKPDLTGATLELEQQSRHIQRALQNRGLIERCSVFSGDMFEDIPENGVLYVFKGALHNWQDSSVQQLLSLLFARMKHGSKVLVQTFYRP